MKSPPLPNKRKAKLPTTQSGIIFSFRSLIILRCLMNKTKAINIREINEEISNLPVFIQKILRYPVSTRQILNDLGKLQDARMIEATTGKDPNTFHIVKLFKIKSSGIETSTLGEKSFQTVFCQDPSEEA